MNNELKQALNQNGILKTEEITMADTMSDQVKITVDPGRTIRRIGV